MLQQRDPKLRNSDGVGPEIGASALDHDGDTDPGVIQFEIKPG